MLNLTTPQIPTYPKNGEKIEAMVMNAYVQPSSKCLENVVQMVNFRLTPKSIQIRDDSGNLQTCMANWKVKQKSSTGEDISDKSLMTWTKTYTDPTGINDDPDGERVIRNKVSPDMTLEELSPGSANAVRQLVDLCAAAGYKNIAGKEIRTNPRQKERFEKLAGEYPIANVPDRYIAPSEIDIIKDLSEGNFDNIGMVLNALVGHKVVVSVAVRPDGNCEVQSVESPEFFNQALAGLQRASDLNVLNQNNMIQEIQSSMNKIRKEREETGEVDPLVFE